MKHVHAQRRSGFTLVEVTISAAVMAMLLFAVGLATLDGNKAYMTGMAQDRATSLAQRTLDRIADTISMGGSGGIAPTTTSPATSSITFRTPTGYASGAVTWNAQTRIDFQYSAQDPNDGVDNDRNGFVDDGMVVLTRDIGLTTEESIVLTRGVREYLEGETAAAGDNNANGLGDERGLCFQLAGDQLTIWLTIVGRDDNGRDVTRTVSTIVKVRN